MSKIIFLTPPAHGHVNPTLPVVQELARRAVEIVLAEPGYRKSAKKLQNSLRATGGYREAADHLQPYIASQGAAA